MYKASPLCSWTSGYWTCNTCTYFKTLWKVNVIFPTCNILCTCREQEQWAIHHISCACDWLLLKTVCIHCKLWLKEYNLFNHIVMQLCFKVAFMIRNSLQTCLDFLLVFAQASWSRAGEISCLPGVKQRWSIVLCLFNTLLRTGRPLTSCQFQHGLNSFSLL